MMILKTNFLLAHMLAKNVKNDLKNEYCRKLVNHSVRGSL
jgi:hypothetical protein